MPKKDTRRYFAIPRAEFEHLNVADVVDILRYEGARPLANSPDGWYTFEKTTDRYPTFDRLSSFHLKTVLTATADANNAHGSCPPELRYQIEDFAKAQARLAAR